jgi:hypothetical protein
MRQPGRRKGQLMTTEQEGRPAMPLLREEVEALREEFDCAAGIGDCTITDGQLLDACLAALERMERALAGDAAPGAGEGPAT